MNLGHYQTHGIWLAFLGLAALVVHLAVPFAINTAIEGDGRVVTREEYRNAEQASERFGVGSGMSGTGVALAGCIILLTAGLLLLMLGQVPLPVDAARWVGWAGGLVGIVGCLILVTSSLLHVAALGASLLELGADHFIERFEGNIYIPLSSTLVAGLGAFALVRCLTLMRSVVTISGGRRDLANLHQRHALYALGFLAIVLLAPWSFHNPPGGQYDWLTVDEILGSNHSSNGDFGFGPIPERWDGLAYALRVMMITAWIGVFAGAIAGAQHILPESSSLHRLRILPRAGLGAGVLVLLWSGIVYILAWAYMWRPTGSANDYQPGYFPIMVLAVLVPWVLLTLRSVRHEIGVWKPERDANAPIRPLRFD